MDQEQDEGFAACVCCGRVWHAVEQKANYVRVRGGDTWYVFCVDTNCPAVWLTYNSDGADVANRARQSMARRKKWR